MIGIDTGNLETGIASFDGVRLHWSRKMRNPALLNMIYASQDALRGKRVVMEMIASFGMPVGQTIFDTCREIGRIQEACEKMGAKVTLVYRKTVAAHICKSAKAGDGNVKRALKDRFGERGTKANPGIFYGVGSDDEWSAIALATWGIDNL